MRTRIEPRIDEAILQACRSVGFKHEVAPEGITEADPLLDEVVAMVGPVCDWPREDIKHRINTLRKKGKQYRKRDILLEKYGKKDA